MAPRHPLLWVAVSSVCFALMGLAGKLASASMTGAQVSAVRFAIMLAPLALVPALRRRALDFGRGDLLLYRGVLGGVAALLYFLAIEHIPIGLATLINFTSPVFAVVFAGLFLGERFDARLLGPLLVTLAGVVLAAGGEAGLGGRLRFGLWEGVALASAVLGGAAVTAVRAARHSEGSWSIYGSFSLFGLLVAAPFAAVDFPRPSATVWWLLLAVGASSVAAQLTMTYAYRWVTNLQAGITLQLTVVLSLLLGIVVLGESWTTLQMTGSAITVAGVAAVIRLQSPPRAVGA